MITETLLLLSSGTLGIFLGAQIAEAVLFVPYWKALKPDNFFELHQTYGKKIYQFFAPLTIAATILPFITVGYFIFYQTGNQILLGLIAFSTFAFFSTYFLYFKRANNSFANRDISDAELLAELRRWEIWHWGRIFFEFIAFGCCLLLLMKC